MSFVARMPYEWMLRTRSIALGHKTRVMGIVNVTPDSFSDGGEHATTERAVAHALQLLDDGADIVDIGGESTRPGSAAATAEAISAAEEQDRVLPVIAGILKARADALISVDTYCAETARAAVQAGAEIVNDVSGGLWDAEMFATWAALHCGVVVMHTRGLPSAWATQAPLAKESVMQVVLEGLQERVQAAAVAGIPRDRIVADPGFGFGKRGTENWGMLAKFASFQELDLPLMAGLSRKGFLASGLTATDADATQTRDALTHAADLAAILGGAHLLRVHDVRGAVQSASVADAVLNANG
ncbi:MAG: dihydropteroate synthase [Janthinobacterium lividum]